MSRRSACTHPMTRTHPSGSFLILGLMSALLHGMSSGFSSFAHVSRFLQTKTMSLVTQSISVKVASKTPLPKSCLFASRSSASWSLMLTSRGLVCYVTVGSQSMLRTPNRASVAGRDGNRAVLSCVYGRIGGRAVRRRRYHR